MTMTFNHGVDDGAPSVLLLLLQRPPQTGGQGAVSRRIVRLGQAWGCGRGRYQRRLVEQGAV